MVWQRSYVKFNSERRLKAGQEGDMDFFFRCVIKLCEYKFQIIKYEMEKYRK